MKPDPQAELGVECAWPVRRDQNPPGRWWAIAIAVLLAVGTLQLLM